MKYGTGSVWPVRRVGSVPAVSLRVHVVHLARLVAIKEEASQLPRPTVVRPIQELAGGVGSKYAMRRLTCGFSGRGGAVAPKVGASTRPRSSRLTDGRTPHTGAA